MSPAPTQTNSWTATGLRQISVSLSSPGPHITNRRPSLSRARQAAASQQSHPGSAPPSFVEVSLHAQPVSLLLGRKFHRAEFSYDAKFWPPSTSTLRNPEHWIPGTSQERDLQVAEAVQAVFGFGFEEHGQRVATTLASEEDFIAIQLQTHPMRGQNEVAGCAARPARGTGAFDPQLFDRTKITGAARSGNKSVAAQHSQQRVQRCRHG